MDQGNRQLIRFRRQLGFLLLVFLLLWLLLT